MRSCVHSAMGSSSFVMLLSVLGVGLVKAFCNLVDGVVITGTLRHGGMSDSVHGGGIDSIIGTLGDVCVFTSSSICVKIWGCLVGAVVWASGAWRLIRLLDAVESSSRSLFDFSIFSFDIPLADCLIFRMALTT